MKELRVERKNNGDVVKNIGKISRRKSKENRSKKK